MADDTKQELADYKHSLEDIQRQLRAFREQHSMPASMQHAAAGVRLIAVDGLLTRLGTVDPSTITLDEIVQVSDDVREVLQSARVFLQRYQPAAPI